MTDERNDLEAKARTLHALLDDYEQDPNTHRDYVNLERIETAWRALGDTTLAAIHWTDPPTPAQGTYYGTLMARTYEFIMTENAVCRAILDADIGRN